MALSKFDTMWTYPGEFPGTFEWKRVKMGWPDWTDYMLEVLRNLVAHTPPAHFHKREVSSKLIIAAFTGVGVDRLTGTNKKDPAVDYLGRLLGHLVFENPPYGGIIRVAPRVSDFRIKYKDILKNRFIRILAKQFAVLRDVGYNTPVGYTGYNTDP